MSRSLTMIERSVTKLARTLALHAILEGRSAISSQLRTSNAAFETRNAVRHDDTRTTKAWHFAEAARQSEEQ